MDRQGLPSFSEPWDYSDVIIIVEGHRLHVHRSILSMCSPVFRKMLSSDFKEKTSLEINLPGKTVETIREMLRLMYPFPTVVSDSSNVTSLLALAREYQMTKMTARIEDVLLRRQTSVELLLIAQEYSLEKLLEKCTCTLSRQSFTDIKQHNHFEDISAENLVTILQGHVKFLKDQHTRDQRTLRENFNKRKAEILEIVNEVNVCWGYNKLPIRGCTCPSYTKSCADCNSALEKFIKLKCGELIEHLQAID